MALLEHGHEAQLLCGGPIEPRPYPVVSTGGTYSQYLTSPFVYRKVAKDADLLIDTENGIPFFSPLWRRKPVVALLHHVHSDQWADRFPAPLAALGDSLESKAMPLVYRRTPFLVLSESTAADLSKLGIDRSRITILPPGVDQPSVVGVAKTAEPTFVCLGRLMPHKRVDLVVRAWEQVRPLTGGRLVIAGDGPERASLEAMAGDDVVFLGKVSEEQKWELLAQAWLFLHPAHHEGWGIVIMEAAEAETPSLGFDVPGVRDAIVDGETGVVASTEEQFIASWVRLGTDAAFRDQLARGAKRRAAEYAWSHVGARFVDYVLETVASWPS